MSHTHIYQGDSAQLSALQVGTSTTAGYVLTGDASGNATFQAPTGGGGSSLAVQDHQVEQNTALLVYDGIAPAGTPQSSTGWNLIKKVISGNDNNIMSVYSASDSWNNRASATYTLSNTYSV